MSEALFIARLDSNILNVSCKTDRSLNFLFSSFSCIFKRKLESLLSPLKI